MRRISPEAFDAGTEASVEISAEISADTGTEPDEEGEEDAFGETETFGGTTVAWTALSFTVEADETEAEALWDFLAVSLPRADENKFPVPELLYTPILVRNCCKRADTP
jgi:hypothetical protein